MLYLITGSTIELLWVTTVFDPIWNLTYFNLEIIETVSSFHHIKTTDYIL
jgi:hypothetical protein